MEFRRDLECEAQVSELRGGSLAPEGELIGLREVEPRSAAPRPHACVPSHERPLSAGAAVAARLPPPPQHPKRCAGQPEFMALAVGVLGLQARKALGNRLPPGPELGIRIVGWFAGS